MQRRPRGLTSTFVIVWIGQLVSLTGSNLTGFALGVWVYQATGSATQLALISFCVVLPGVAISPIAGVLVDRWSHRWTMVLSDTGSALSILAIAPLAFSGDLETWHIYLATSLSSAFSAFQWPAYNAAVTLLVQKKHLGRANGMIQLGVGCAQLVAPLLGALLLGVIGLEGVILLEFSSYLFAVVPLIWLRFPKQYTAMSREGSKRFLLHDIGDACRYIASRPGLLGMLLSFSVFSFFVGTVEVLVTPLVLSFSSTVALGTVMTIGGLGMATGGVVMSVWGGPERCMLAVLAFMLLGGLSIAVAGIGTSIVLLAASAFFFFLGIPVINACSQQILQRKVALNFQGRVFALRMGIQQAAVLLGYSVAGPLADYVFEPLMAANGRLANTIGWIIGKGPGRGVGLMFVIAGILIVLLTLVAYYSPRVRRLDTELPDVIPEHIVEEGEPVAA